MSPSIIVIFVFLQILVKSEAAVARYGMELQTQRAVLQSEEEQIVRRLLAMLDDLRTDLYNDQQIAADDPNVSEEGDYHPPSSPNGSGASVGNDEQRSPSHVHQEAKDNWTKRIKEQLTSIFLKNGAIPTESHKEEKVKILEEIVENIEHRSSCCTRAISLYPTCDHWNLTKENDHNKDSIHLYFDISKSKPSSNVNFNVSSAVLKIYKKAFKPTTRYPEISPDKNVTIRVVFHTRDSRRKSIKLGKQTLRSDAEQWTQWDVKRAIEKWYSNASTNYGITIKVEEEEAILPAREFFNTLNCSNITALPPLLPETLRRGSMANISTETPFLDLIFDEVAKVDNKLTNKEKLILNDVLNLKNKIMSGSDSSAERKTRSRKK